MKQIADLIPAPSDVSRARPQKKSEVTDEHIAYLWRCMVMFFGHRWVTAFGETDNGTWRSGLCDVTPAQILHGIDVVRLSGKGWPPTLPEFRKMCVTPPAEPPKYYRSLEQQPDWDKIQPKWHALSEYAARLARESPYATRK